MIGIGQNPSFAQLSYAYAPAFSAVANKLYVLSGANADSVSTSENIPGGSQSIENPTCMSSVNPASGWRMTSVTPATIGFSASGNPLTVAAPLLLP